MSSIVVHEPDTDHESLREANFPYDAWLGTWKIVASTIPMWKEKKNVSITYGPIGSSPITEQLDDLVEYHDSLSASPTSKRKAIRGVDKRDQTPLRDGQPWKESGVRWQWRGKGFLAIATSRMQILGYSLRSEGEQWCVVTPRATLFTPTGINVYSRTGSLPRPLLDEILTAVRKLTDPEIVPLLDSFFDVVHDA